MGLARIPAKLEVSSEALTLVTVPPETSAIAPKFSRSQASLSTETTSIVTPLAADCTMSIRPSRGEGNGRGVGERTSTEQENLAGLDEITKKSTETPGSKTSFPSIIQVGNRMRSEVQALRGKQGQMFAADLKAYQWVVMRFVRRLMHT